MDVLVTCAQAADVVSKMHRACARQSARVGFLHPQCSDALHATACMPRAYSCGVHMRQAEASAPIEAKLRASLALRNSGSAKRSELTRQISTMRSLLVGLPPGRASAVTLGLYAVHLHAAGADAALVCDFYRHAILADATWQAPAHLYHWFLRHTCGRS